MIKRFVLPAIGGVILAILALHGHPLFYQAFLLINTVADYLLQIFLTIGPFIIFFSLTLGIMGIKNDYLFYLKFFIIIFVSLFGFGLLFYGFLNFIYPYIISDSLPLTTEGASVLFPSTGIFKVIYTGIKNFNNFFKDYLSWEILICLLLGLALAYFDKSKKIANGFRFCENKLFWLIKTFLLPLMPIWTISVFAKMAYSSSVDGFIYNDIVMSLVIFGAQLLFLAIMYKLGSLRFKVSFNKIINSAKNLYAQTLQMMGVGGNLILPFATKAQTDLGVNPSYAKTITISSFNLPGSFIANIGFAYGIIVASNQVVSSGTFINYIFLLVVATIVAPTTPLAVSAITSQLLTPILGFNDNQVQVMQSLYFNQGTTNAAANNCGDIYLGLLLSPKPKNKANN